VYRIDDIRKVLNIKLQEFGKLSMHLR